MKPLIKIEVALAVELHDLQQVLEAIAALPAISVRPTTVSPVTPEEREVVERTVRS